MDIAWEEFRPLLRRAYFGDDEDSLATRDSDVFDDFWAFFRKYVAAAKRKGALADRAPRRDTFGLSFGVYSKFCRQNTAIQLSKAARYGIREVPEYVVVEFEYAVHSYLAFCERERLQRLKKLRHGQKSLPIAAFREPIVDAVRNNNVVIIAGDTGCGKSTQVPQYLLAAGFEHIACTQPRRIACISLAKRVSFETLREFGSLIAYQIRFERTRTIATRIIFLTEGLLLRQLAADRSLSSYQVVILDEIHERHLQGDLLMGLLRLLVRERTDLKLILMSATINLQLFSGYFPSAPVVQVPGRLYPIQLHYLPTPAAAEAAARDDKRASSQKIDAGPFRRVLQMVDAKVPSSERGDMLIFLSGISEITTVAEALKQYAEETSKWIILILHSTLSLVEQDKVFDVAPDGVRKCVLSTNIAETSVTIDGVRFVVDSGKVKEMRYDAATRIHQLKEVWVSQASAEQRKGRAGRTGPGVCYRLYATDQYAQFDAYTTSEIRRVSLESLALQMYHLDVNVEPKDFPFIEPPGADSLTAAVEALCDQGALRAAENDRKELTALGKMLVNLPVDVSVGKILVMGCLFQQIEVVLTLAAGLSVQSPFTNRSYRDPDCIALRRNLASDHGDPFALLNVYREWMQVKSAGSEPTRRWCQKRGVEEQRLYEITKLRRQFSDLLEDADLIERRSMVDAASLTGVERRIRAGEMKRLRDLKRKARNEQRKRKVLKSDEHFDEVGKDVEDMRDDGSKWTKADGADVHAVEFDMRHSASDISEALRRHRMDHSSALLVKAIVCSGLYPQFGVLDQHNSYKPGADQMLHTRAKPFVVLHPNSCLAQEPECLAHTLDKEGRSSNHQLIFYGLLLETTKTYVVNSMRVPALHMALLLARSVQTSADYTRVLCDDFVEFVLPSGADGEQLVATASALRELMSQCLERKLGGDSYRSEKLARRLLDFFSTEVVYSVKREVRRPNEGDAAVPKGTSVGRLPSAVVGDTAAFSSQYISAKWQCRHCGEEFYSAAAERLIHLNECEPTVDQPPVDGDDSSQPQSANAAESSVGSTSSSKKQFYCDHCDSDFWFTPVDVLRHKRKHAAQ